MPKGDDILLGASIAPSTDSDSDGDGVSDSQERLDGTDAGDPGDHLTRDPTLERDVIDPRGDLDRATLEREVGFDPMANMPEGMSIDSGLKGLTNVDGTALSTGANHFGIGEDSLLTGRLGANSPLDMLKEPAVVDGPKGTGGLPPAGAELGGRGPKWDLVGGEGEEQPDEFELPGAIQPVAPPAPPMSDPPPPPPDPERQPPPPPKPDGEDPDPDPEPGPTPLQTDPDSGGNGGVNVVGGGGVPLDIHGPRVVQGAGGGPQVEGAEPPVRYIDLVTDGGDGSVDTSSTMGTLRGKPDAPVVHTVNPDAGFVQPPIGGQPPGGGGGDDLGLYGSSSAATAASADAPDALGISLAGSGGGGGIGSVAPAAEPPDLVSGVRDMSVRSVGNVGAQHSAPDAVDRFAKEYLEDASLETPTGDPFLATGLTADLGADLAAAPDDLDFRSPDDLDVDSPDGLAGFDGDYLLDP